MKVPEERYSPPPTLFASVKFLFPSNYAQHYLAKGETYIQENDY